MPYIRPEARRETLNKVLQVERWEIIDLTSGELNYIITKLIMAQVKHKGLSYDTICSISGVLDNVSKEFYRRVAVPFEDKKKEENGDVF